MSCQPSGAGWVHARRLGSHTLLWQRKGRCDEIASGSGGGELLRGSLTEDLVEAVSDHDRRYSAGEDLSPHHRLDDVDPGVVTGDRGPFGPGDRSPGLGGEIGHHQVELALEEQAFIGDGDDGGEAVGLDRCPDEVGARRVEHTDRDEVDGVDLSHLGCGLQAGNRLPVPRIREREASVCAAVRVGGGGGVVAAGGGRQSEHEGQGHGPGDGAPPVLGDHRACGGGPTWESSPVPVPTEHLFDRLPTPCPATPSCTVTATSRSSTVPPIPATWYAERRSWATRRWRSPITTASTGRPVSASPPPRSGCPRCTGWRWGCPSIRCLLPATRCRQDQREAGSGKRKAGILAAAAPT